MDFADFLNAITPEHIKQEARFSVENCTYDVREMIDKTPTRFLNHQLEHAINSEYWKLADYIKKTQEKRSKMKKYIITVSEVFPKTHSNAGEPTQFVRKIKNFRKLHTIRTNYEFWKKRIDEIQAGKAQLHIRTWSGKPYASKQVEHLILGKQDGVGIQKLVPGKVGYNLDGIDYNGDIGLFCTNDGLSYKDFKEWFKKVKPNEELAIIHFTKFRYEKTEK